MGALTGVFNGISRAGAKMLFKIKKASPEILIGGGVILIAAGAVVACVNTKKVVDVVERNSEIINDTRQDADAGACTQEYADTVIKEARVDTIKTVVKAYSLPVGLGVVGIVLIGRGHGITRRQSQERLAAFNAVYAAFQQYRDNVRKEENGAELDKKYFLGKDLYEDWKNCVENPDDQTQEMLDNTYARARQKVLRCDGNYGLGLYTFEFSNITSNKWSMHEESNRDTIRYAEDWGNLKLDRRGYLFLNEMLEQLDMDPVPWGQLVGWKKGENGGDGYVEILSTQMRNSLDEHEGWRRPILMEFNCDGEIWDKISPDVTYL